LTFEDGTTATCDVLVGADGLHSSVRRSLLTEIAQSYRNEGKEEEAKDALDGIEPVWSGTNAYRAVVPAEVLAKEFPEHRALTTQLHVRSSSSFLSLFQANNHVTSISEKDTCVSYQTARLELIRSGISAHHILPYPTRKDHQHGFLPRAT